MDEIIQVVKYAIYVVFAYLNIDIEVFAILILFMCIDSILGAIKADRLGSEFSFKIMLWGFCLKLCFLIVPLIIALLGKGMSNDFSIGVDIVMKILIVSECYSALGNIYAAKNKVDVKKMDVVSMLLKSIREFLRKWLNKTLSTIENASDCNIDKNNKK